MWSCSSMLSSSFRDGRRAAEFAAIGFIKREVNMVGFCTVDFAKGSPDAILLDKACLVLWDEAPMVRCHCFEALDRIFRDILAVYDSSRSLFPLRGKVVVVSGDFKQVLPVMQEGAKTGIIGASLVMSPLWRHIKLYVMSARIEKTIGLIAFGRGGRKNRNNDAYVDSKYSY
ncbi:uncharacterized protein [Triticum aestivum]|uniref:uncharacterized protein n=1 Tax=Triticum aestivum TaxID=4565 RepID=UPI0008424D29|nr:uncharacterized protein LOC123144883 [Triticum aestivum]